MVERTIVENLAALSETDFQRLLISLATILDAQIALKKAMLSDVWQIATLTKKAVDTLPGPLDLSQPGSDAPVRDVTAARLVERERTERVRRLAAAGVVVGPAETAALSRVLREVARRRRQVGR